MGRTLDVGVVPDRVELLRHVGGARPSREPGEVLHVGPGGPEPFHDAGVEVDEGTRVLDGAPCFGEGSIPFDVVGPDAPRVVGCGARPRHGPEPDEGSNPLGMGRCEQRHAGTPFEHTTDHRTLSTHGLHHRERVRDPGLEVRGSAFAARTPGAAPVVHDHAGVRRHPLEDRTPVRLLPPFVHDREHVVLPEDVDRALAERLVGEVGPVGRSGELDTGSFHPRIVRPMLPAAQLVRPGCPRWRSGPVSCRRDGRSAA